MATTSLTTAEQAFERALAAEQKGEHVTADRWLKLAEKKDREERGLPAVS